MTKLRERFKRDLEIKGYSPKTQQAYLGHIVRFAQYYGKSPDLLGTEEIKDYLHYIITERKLSKSYINQVYSSIKFFHETTLNRKWEMNSIPRVKKDKKLPEIFTKEEVKKILDNTTNLKHKAILATIYASGLRVSEVVNLKISDINSSEMQIKICGGKGKKDRLTILSESNLKILREYFKYYRPGHWLFPGADYSKPLTTRSVECVLEKSKEKAGIVKPATVHSLRHSFATHLLENGTDIYYIQKLLGHSNIKTTSIYLHMTTVKMKSIKSPLDTIDGDKNE